MDIALMLGVWIGCVLAGAAIGYTHGATLYGLLWPLILGPLGLLLTVVLLRNPPATD